MSFRGLLYPPTPFLPDLYRLFYLSPPHLPAHSQPDIYHFLYLSPPLSLSEVYRLLYLSPPPILPTIPTPFTLPISPPYLIHNIYSNYLSPSLPYLYPTEATFSCSSPSSTTNGFGSSNFSLSSDRFNTCCEKF